MHLLMRLGKIKWLLNSNVERLSESTQLHHGFDLDYTVNPRRKLGYVFYSRHYDTPFDKPSGVLHFTIYEVVRLRAELRSSRMKFSAAAPTRNRDGKVRFSKLLSRGLLARKKIISTDFVTKPLLLTNTSHGSY